MHINNDPRLSPTERMALQQVRDRLSHPPRAPLPEGYSRHCLKPSALAAKAKQTDGNPMPTGDNDAHRNPRWPCQTRKPPDG